jgi:hypothetical protein
MHMYAYESQNLSRVDHAALLKRSRVAPVLRTNAANAGSLLSKSPHFELLNWQPADTVMLYAAWHVSCCVLHGTRRVVCFRHVSWYAWATVQVLSR